MRQLSAAQENIKKQLICRRAKERSRPGLRWDCCYLQSDLKMQKNMEKMAFSVTSAHLCRGMSDGGREEATNKGSLQSA